jgi:Ran GTPase-activating protein (RanGAP) involved in mRNA processing and transport
MWPINLSQNVCSVGQVPFPNQICDDGLCALASAFSEISPSSIKSLNLRANSISCMGASVLAQSFHRQHALMSLDLSQNSIGLLGSERLAIGIKSLPLLLSLNLSQVSSSFY